MNGSKLALKWIGVCATGILLLAGSASAQWSGIVKVSDAIEAPNSQFTGAVSAARCGTNIVVGFGDQESSSANSFAGYAISHNNGATFSDRGVLPVSPDTSGGFGPDQIGAVNGLPAAITPSVTCANSSLFYYASVYTARSNAGYGSGCAGGPICSTISLSTSKNGGTTWGLPTQVAVRSGDVHDLIFPMMAVDPSNAQRLYVGYVVFNCCGPEDADEPCLPTYALRLASSMDAGTTWTDTRVDYACTDGGLPAEIFGEIMAPSVAVGPDGKVYVAYEFIPGSPVQVNEIRFSRSLDHGRLSARPCTYLPRWGTRCPNLRWTARHPHFAAQSI